MTLACTLLLMQAASAVPPGGLPAADEVRADLGRKYTPGLIRSLVAARHAKQQLAANPDPATRDALRAVERTEQAILNSIRWARVRLPSEAELQRLTEWYAQSRRRGGR